MYRGSRSEERVRRAEEQRIEAEQRGEICLSASFHRRDERFIEGSGQRSDG
jgi:hypothetical protein